MTTKIKEKKSEWKSIVQGFVGDMLARVSDNVSKRVNIFISQLKQRAIGAILLLIGLIFLLIGCVIFINVIIGNEFPWLGYSIVGFALILIGYIMLKEQK